MRRTFAVFAAAVVGLLASAGQAMAQDPGGSAEQAAANAAASAQSALGLANALQSKPSNTNTAVPVLSPGKAGSVSQSNTVIAGSVAANGNSTTQTASQTQAGGSGTQTAGQIAGNEQSATSTADAAQLGAANENIDVRVLSPGNGGSVSQSNNVLAGSLAGNHNQTTQTATQSQAGGPGSGSQTVGQAASNEQDATSDATAKQYGAKNTNISVRILSDGDDGSVEQSNTVAGISAALNGNSTTQSATQGSSGYPGGGGTQTALQGATSKQGADSSADAEQKGAKNENIAVRILSPGKGGSVSQSNTAIAGSLAKNGNATTQTASQSQGGGYGSGEQVVGQAATNDQDAWSDADATQYGASNTNIPIRIFSDGDDGAVSQSNTVLGLSAALNGNETTQSATQTQGGAAPVTMPYAERLSYPEWDPYSDKEKQPYPDKDKKDEGTGVQAIGQLAESTQVAGASSDATQVGASNTNVPVRIGSEGNDGDVSQSNTTISAAIAANGNETSQTATQNQSGPGTLVQGIAQAALNKQAALACAKALQKDATNTNTPVGVFGQDDKDGKGDYKDGKGDYKDGKGDYKDGKGDYKDGKGDYKDGKGDYKDDKGDYKDGKGDYKDEKDGKYDRKGDGGSVSQSNTAAAIVAALNGNETTQSATQTQSGRGGSPLVQAIGQLAGNEQDAVGTGDAFQGDVANGSTPVTIGDDFDKRGCEKREQWCDSKRPVEPKCDWKRDECEPKPPVEPKCDWKRDECEPKPPVEPKCDWKRDECEPKPPVEPKCDWKRDECDSKRPVEPPKCDWKKDECEPKRPVEPRKCESRKEPCEWKKPVEPPTCEARMPKYEPCGSCDRPNYKNCPDRRWDAK